MKQGRKTGKKRSRKPGMKRSKILILVLVAVLCFGAAAYYPISYHLAEKKAVASLKALSAMHAQARQAVEVVISTPRPEATVVDWIDVAADVTETPAPTPTPRPTPAPTPTLAPGETPRPTDEIMAYILDYVIPTWTPIPTSTPFATAVPSPTPDRFVRTGALAYDMKEKVELDESKILPELKEIYELNHDLIGWITIPNADVDYPVVQSSDRKYYLEHDFYGEPNNHGQIILDGKCDPYTPSYNLSLSGHNMLNGTMFAKLLYYGSQAFWRAHKIVEFDSLMERKEYVVFACFYSADYDEDEEGFRYSADIRYKQDADAWLEEIRENRIYDTGIDAEFGDEFITLTTCTTQRQKNGRFVLVCRRLREGESF